MDKFGYNVARSRNKVHVRRKNLKELVAAIQDLEVRGYECSAPFKKRMGNSENDRNNHTYYEVYMEKETRKQ